MKVIFGYSTILLWLFLMGCSNNEENRPSGSASVSETASAENDQQGWVSLFDGETLDGWRGLGQDGIPEGHWIVAEGDIRKVATDHVVREEDSQPITGIVMQYDQHLYNYYL